MTIEIYTTPSCHYCKLAKEFFTKHGIAYIERDAREPQNLERVVALTGKRSVPVTVAKDIILSGFDEKEFEQRLLTRE